MLSIVSIREVLFDVYYVSIFVTSIRIKASCELGDADRRSKSSRSSLDSDQGVLTIAKTSMRA